uniref:Reverse transcriptase domain-containing protein n=1 Tax=Oreochromis aureus TaxID=47969 RepID=A0AAZ1Y652_OREAU
MHPEGREYSFYSPPHNVYTRIDYFLISEALVNNSIDSSIGNIVISDHAPIFLCLGNILQIPQSHRWRLNVSLIKDSGFIKLIRDEIQFYKQTNNREDTTLATWWDAMKAYLLNKNIITLEAKLKALEAVHSHTKDRVTLNKIVKVKYKLNVLYNRKWEFRWSVNGLRYLGIQITSDYTKMVRANMEPMFERMKMEFGRWSRVRLTIWGKISCIKMMTAPMIFYILSNIPLHIPDKYFKDLDFLIGQFLWGSSPHRLSIKKLQASAKQGRFTLPNFQWYYWVINVKQLRAWLPTAPVKPIWSYIETEVNGGISPWRELFDTSHKLTHPIIANAKTLWCKLHRAGRWDFIKSPSCFKMEIWYLTKTVHT